MSHDSTPAFVRRTDGGYATFPNRWIDAGYMAQVPGSVTQVYFFLCRWADNTSHEAQQTMSMISMKTGINEDLARKSLRLLEEWGVIEREPPTDNRSPNSWTLNTLLPKAPPPPHKTQAPTSQAPKSEARKPEATLSDLEYQPKLEQPEKTIPPTPKGEKTTKPKTILNQTQTELFESWYEMYPRKQARANAVKAWAKISPAPDEKMVDQMIAKVQEWSQSDQWRKNNGQYIPLPASWLNSEGWMDGPPIVILAPDETPSKYVAMIESDKIAVLNNLFNGADSSFGEGWIPYSLRRLEREVPGLDRDRLIRGLNLACSRFKDRWRGEDPKLRSNPTGLTYFIFREALQEQAL